MVHSVLLYVEQPTYNTDETLNWNPFLAAARAIATQSTGIQPLGEVCWLIDVRSDLDKFVSLAHAVQDHKLRYRVLFFAEEPAWIRPSTAAGQRPS